MPTDVPAVPPLVPPALARPLRLGPFRARRLDLSLVGGPPGPSSADLVTRMLGHDGVTRDTHPALYVHEYTVDHVTVRGLVGVLDLSAATVTGLDRADAGMLPHEGVDHARVERLGTRLGELDVDPAPMLLLREPAEPGGPDLAALTSGPPSAAGADARGVRHQVWSVHDTTLVRELTDAVADSGYLLADGHHRYAAHLALGHPTALAMLVDGDTCSVALRPIHRLLHGTDLATVTAALRAVGHAVAVPGPIVGDLDGEDHSGEDATLTLLGGGESVVAGLEAIPGQHTLDTVDALLRGLGAPEVTHHHSVRALRTALDRAERAEGPAVAVILSPPSLAEVWSAAREGRLLPEKTTSFQPKPALGVLFRSWRDE